MLAPLLLLIAAVSAIAVRRARRRSLPAQAVIVSPRRSTVIERDGAVRSVQSAKLTIEESVMTSLWTPANLENLARTYWRFLSHVTLHLIRVVYDEDTRAVVLLVRPLTLLRFEKPTYTTETDHGAVNWQIRDGLLVARSGRGSGFLALDVRREPAPQNGRWEMRIEVEVANFFPSIAGTFSTPAYEMTQSFVHVIVTHAFLRSLAKLHLARSRIGSLAVSPEDDQP